MTESVWNAPLGFTQPLLVLRDVLNAQATGQRLLKGLRTDPTVLVRIVDLPILQLTLKSIRKSILISMLFLIVDCIFPNRVKS